MLIVGCGHPARDLGGGAVAPAKRVDLSVRRGYYFLPKFIGGRPSDSIGGKIKLPRRLKQWLDARLIRMIIGRPSDYGLPDPDYRLYEAHPVINSLVLHHLGHGDITPRTDIADMQGHTVTFIDSSLLNWHDDAPRLYLNVFHPHYDNLFMMGMIEAAGLGWEGRNEQAELVALYLKRRAEGAATAARLEATKRERAGETLDGGYRYLKLSRMAYYVHKDSYRAEVANQRRALQEQ